MQGNVQTEVAGNPAGHVVDLAVRVVLARDQQRGQFEPGVRFRFQVTQRVEHRLQVCAADLPVEALGERFQVDVDGIHTAEKFIARVLGDITGRDGHVLDAAFVAGGSHVDCVLQEDHRIVVGISDAAAAAVGRGGCDGRRRRGCLQPIKFAGLRDVPVLAELAGEVAARGAERQYRRAGQEMIQRLLLDRIDAKAAGTPIRRQQHLVIAVGPHETEPALACVQPAIPRAQVALQPTIIKPVPVAGGLAPNGVSCVHDL
jgi:hypothetical protein